MKLAEHKAGLGAEAPILATGYASIVMNAFLLLKGLVLVDRHM